MTAGKPVKVKVEYDDGTSRDCEVASLSPAGWAELAKAGLLPDQREGSEESRYVLVEWKNGWKEVYSVPSDVTEVRRYYVIRRAEETGRLFLNRSEGYPEMIEILRKPNEVEKVSLL